jgi:hypothetical protein
MRCYFWMVWFLVISFVMLPLTFAATGDSPPIPTDFKYVEGTVADGFVVKDKAGNEFVWIPVKGPLQRVDWKNQTVSVADTTEEIPPEISGSIAKHEGFYIGRYEARIKDPSLIRIQNDPIQYRLSADWYTAKWACGKMATDYDYKDVLPHLPYDAEWDAIMVWLEKSGVNLDDSHKEGNYIDNPQRQTQRGYPWFKSPYRFKQIFDLAGNFREWTMAEYRGNYRVVRGGGFNGMGVFESVSSRQYRDASTSEESMGFRPALVLKN